MDFKVEIRVPKKIIFPQAHFMVQIDMKLAISFLRISWSKLKWNEK